VAILVYASPASASPPSAASPNATLAAIMRCVTYGLVAGALLVLRGSPSRRASVSIRPGVAPAAIAFYLWLLSTRTFAQAWVSW
jgi:hypothetical protein